MAASSDELLSGLDKFFEFLLNLESAGLFQKKDILNAYFELFECAQEQHLQPLFNMMETKLFSYASSAVVNQSNDGVESGSNPFFQGTSDRDQSILINIFSKVCKTIMRKLSATHDTEFRGRIQQFIATVFPLTHASGLNKFGYINVKNTTNFESHDEIRTHI